MSAVFFSEKYTTSANITAGQVSTELFISEDDAYGYGPFDQMTVINNDSIILEVQLDRNPANVIRVLPNSREGSSQLAFMNFAIKNADTGTHTAGKIAIIVEQTKRPRMG